MWFVFFFTMIGGGYVQYDVVEIVTAYQRVVVFKGVCVGHLAGVYIVARFVGGIACTSAASFGNVGRRLAGEANGGVAVAFMPASAGCAVQTIVVEVFNGFLVFTIYIIDNIALGYFRSH